MKIIKPGRDVENIYHKVCPICSCEFKFAEWEIKTNFVAMSIADLKKPTWQHLQVRQIICPNPTCRQALDVVPGDKLNYVRLEELERVFTTAVECTTKCRRNMKNNENNT